MIEVERFIDASWQIPFADRLSLPYIIINRPCNTSTEGIKTLYPSPACKLAPTKSGIPKQLPRIGSHCLRRAPADLAEPIDWIVIK